MTGQIKIIKDGENKGDRQDAYFYLIKPLLSPRTFHPIERRIHL